MPKGEHLKGKGGIKFGQGQDNTQGGRKPKPKFADLLQDISENDGKIRFDKFEIKQIDGKEYVEVQLSNDTSLAIKLLNMASKDVRWFDIYAKVMNLYAPNKTDVKILRGADELFIEE